MDTIPQRTALEICERAARFHRQRVVHNEHLIVIKQSIVPTPKRLPIIVGRDGWAHVGAVDDLFENLHLRVYWHVDTDNVRLERPVDQPLPEPARMVGDPLYRTDPVYTAAESRPFSAQAGYIYTYQGVDYDAEATEKLTATLGSIEGWTWRRS